MVLLLSRMALDVALGGYDILLARVINFLVIAVVTGHSCNASGVSLLSLFANLGSFPSTLNGGLGRCCIATTGCCFHVGQNKSSSNRLLTIGVLGGDIMQLFGGA
jgi:hypothetical protein